MHKNKKGLLAVVLAAGVVAAFPTFGRDMPDLRAANALVMDSETGKVLFAKNEQAIVPIASITKLMTAMVVLDASLDLDEMVEVVEEDQSKVKFSRSRLAIGTEIRRADLLRMALMASDNRAASALARTYPGGTDAAISAMNAKAKLIGLEHTRFEEPTGLSSNNVSSAADLARMVSAARGYPLIRDFSTTPEYEIHTNRGRLAFANTNGLIRKGAWEIDVQKTGFISEAGRCLVLSVRMAARPFTIVLLDAAGRYTHFADAQRIRQWLDPSYSIAAESGPVHRVRTSTTRVAGHTRAAAQSKPVVAPRNVTPTRVSATSTKKPRQ
jgi:D-alanyl-D-alanine endopeptidase (penicillin-binding protein 7)